MTYYSLASGFLSGKYRTVEDAQKSVRGEQVIKKYLNARGLRILNALDQIARETKATPAQVALAWLIRQPAVTSAIVSATNVYQLTEIMQSAQLALNNHQIEALYAASA